MIAYRDECDHDLLVELLHARLEHDEELCVTSHLERCEACRRELDQLTAPVGWWLDTQRILKDSRSLATPVEPSPTLPIENAVAWVVNLLKPAQDSHSIGTLDGWPVREVIGQGGMGVVLKVWDEELHRPLAVKLLSPMLASNGASRQRFFREAQAAAAVVHPNIVPIYTVASDGVLPYLVMPFVAGGNLQQRIDREGPLPLTEVLSVGVQIAGALVAAHRLGLVHRDIKPANILLDDGGHRVLLSDFGLARTIDDASLTNSGMVAGTPQYMSPEQARGMSIDPRSDLYSLGAVLYAMATGRPPVRGDSTLAILRKVGEEQPVPVYDINETMPLWLNRLVQRFLEKHREARIANAQDAVELLRTSLAHARAPARNPLPQVLQERTTTKKKRLVQFVALMVGTILVATLMMSTIQFIASGVTSNQSDYRGHTKAEQVKQTVPSSMSHVDQRIPFSLDELTFDSDLPNRLLQLEAKLRDLKASLETE